MEEESFGQPRRFSLQGVMHLFALLVIALFAIGQAFTYKEVTAGMARNVVRDSEATRWVTGGAG